MSERVFASIILMGKKMHMLQISSTHFYMGYTAIQSNETKSPVVIFFCCARSADIKQRYNEMWADYKSRRTL